MSGDEEGEFEIHLRHLHKQKGRYAVSPKGYVLDRMLFWVYSALLILTAIIIVTPDLLAGDLQKAYVRCPNDAMGAQCDNPLYGRCDLPACQKQTLAAGETIGEPPGNFFDLIMYCTMSPLLILFLFNHFNQHSRRYERVRRTHNKQ